MSSIALKQQWTNSKYRHLSEKTLLLFFARNCISGKMSHFGQYM